MNKEREVMADSELIDGDRTRNPNGASRKKRPSALPIETYNQAQSGITGISIVSLRGKSNVRFQYP